MIIKLYTDGGARGNPGPAAIGAVLKDTNNKVLKELGVYIGVGTNNDAEYKALILGLEECEKNQATEVTCFIDSELVVKQLNGEYKVKNERMKKYWKIVKGLEKGFEEISYEHVKRGFNEEADALVNKVLDAVQDAEATS
jgi:ribonuclease HI